MSVIKKPDLKIFAQDAKTGEIETFPDVLRGWGITLDRTAGKPPLEWFNAVGKRVDEWLMYLTQRGVAEWDAALSYPKTAIVQWNGVIYVSNKETKGEQPDKSQAAWSTLGVFLGLGNYYTKTDTDTKFQLKGNYALKGESYTKVESDTRFQPKGNYLPSGYSYSKSESDTKYQPKGNYATNTDIQKITSQTIFDRAIVIPLNADLNDYLSSGLYFQPNGSPGANSKNYPSNTAGSLEVVKTGNFSVKQIYTAWYDNKTWIRRYNGGNKTWADKWDEDFTKLNPPTAADVGAYSTQQVDAKFQAKGNYLDKNSPQEQITKGFLTATRRLSVEAPDKARALLYAVESGNVGISAQDSNGEWLGDIKHPGDGKNGTLARIEDFNTPVGMPIPWPQATTPSGYLICNGQAFNKTTYPLLAKAYPSGKLPDLRGEFIRGLDAGRGIDANRTVLSHQLDAMEKIYGTTSTDSLNNTATGPFQLGSGNGSQSASNQGSSRLLIFDTSRSNRTAAETRPRNIAFLYIVRAA
ncbi:tail fiber protein [Providencia stuartii]